MEGGIPTLDDLRRYQVVRGGEAELVRQTLYDFQLYPTAGANQLTFFAVPQGQGQSTHSGAAAGVTKSFADTNMELAGQLPRFKNFLIQSIEIDFEPGSISTANLYASVSPAAFTAVAAAAVVHQLNDSNIVRNSGWLELNVSSKNYLREAPVGRFPKKCRMEIEAAAASNSATTGAITALSGKWGGRPYYLDAPIVLPDSTNFSVTLNWPNVQATPSGFNGRIGIILDGYLFRASQ